MAVPSSLRNKKTHSTFKKLDSPDHFVHMSVAFEERSSSGILRATTVRPTSPSLASDRKEREKSERQRCTNDLLLLFYASEAGGSSGRAQKRLAAAAPK
jgi:hypothetical protein